jgi:hypothetical protein
MSRRIPQHRLLQFGFYLASLLSFYGGTLLVKMQTSSYDQKQLVGSHHYFDWGPPLDNVRTRPSLINQTVPDLVQNDPIVKARKELETLASQVIRSESSPLPENVAIEARPAAMNQTIHLNSRQIDSSSSHSQSEGVLSENVAFLQVKTPAINQSMGYGNKTAFELLEAARGCNSLMRPALPCNDRCGVAGPNLKSKNAKRNRWCRANCSPSCKLYICQLGNPPPMPVVSEIHVYRPAPSTARDRLVPRIIHQTWREPITRERYPNWSGFQQTFLEQKGYEYRFYSDSEAREILQMQFPPEVVMAFDDLEPGAFKADLFRYCILLIHGGVYGDIDILMTSNLDDLIHNDTGFLVPLDKVPFMVENLTLCLWNGFMAASPGHPYLAKAIENIVNAVRNRHNLVDYVHMVACPLRTKNMKEMSKRIPLFATGPCMLGLTVNQVLGRHEQTTFVLGEHADGNTDIPGKTVLIDLWINEVSGTRRTGSNDLDLRYLQSSCAF